MLLSVAVLISCCFYVLAAGESEQIVWQRDEKKVAITFDDGPDAKTTALLLDGLKARKVRATFFVVGENVEKGENAQILREMSADGHLIGNHTYHHVQLTEVGEEKFKEEIRMTNAVLSEITGETPAFIRPPYGSWNKKYEEELNLFPVLWTVDPLDWCCNSSQCVYQRVVTTVKENDIILLHDCYETSVTAALSIVDSLQAQGYEFVTVDELLLE